MLKLKDIKKDYKVAQSYVHALKGVDLAFRKNEFVCILGPSGCGKTTLLNIIGGLDHYTTGDLVIQGRSTKDFKDRDWDVYRNHRIGFIFQSYNLIPHQTVLGNVELALTIAGVGRDERRERAKQALERVGLGEELGKKPNQLSGGQMQRVAIARALVNNPDILLADEPTGALDSKTSVEVMELIKEIASERLVIMVTHNPELAEKYSSRIVRLKDGMVESDSAPYSEEEEDAERTAVEATPEAEEVPSPESNVETGKKAKKPRAKMSFLTSLALSARNLLTKKGRTIITSVAGSIGIISVCLVLALSSGFNNYIRRTEEDMLSYYPVEIMENTLDLSAVMENAGSLNNLPDMEQIGDKVYVNSFLTQLAQNIAVTNNISEEYINYLEDGKDAHPDWFSAIKYVYGVSLTDNLFTAVTTGGDLGPNSKPLATQYFSLSGLRDFYTEELLTLASEYAALVRYVNFFDDVLGVMPGTSAKARERGEYSDYILSQYDILAADRTFDELGGRTPHFPENENEAVLVIGANNDSTDLTLAQLGFIPESDFMTLFQLGEKEDATGEAEEPLEVPFEDVFAKEYTLYYNDAVYTKKAGAQKYEAAFTYSDERKDENANLNYTDAEGNEIGMPIRITAVLRLKEGRTYGCLNAGISFTEETIAKYIQKNMQSTIVQWAMSEDARLPEGFTAMLTQMAGVKGLGEDTNAYCAPSTHVGEMSNSPYTAVDLGYVREALGAGYGKVFAESIEQAARLLYHNDEFTLPLTRDGMLSFLGTAQEMIIGSLTTPPAEGGEGQYTPEEAQTIFEGIRREVEDLETSFTRAELEVALGAPLADMYAQKEFGDIDLKGIIYVAITEDIATDPVIRLLGGCDKPNGVYIYPSDFDAKEQVLGYLDAWNEVDGRVNEDKITYTDRVGLLMGMVQTMLDVITYVLVAFTAISLVVSSVMIGIITYVSVVERVKEIGVLRSLGARKMDIRNLFNAETFIIGLAAGLIGIIVTYLISIVINIIIVSLSGISGIASLPPLTAFIMVCVSVMLTLISGLIPAQAAAKKDPVIALRTE